MTHPKVLKNHHLHLEQKCLIEYATYITHRPIPAQIGGCCRINLRTNFPGEVVNVGAASPTNMHDTKTYNVYRDDYTPHGHAVCASLQRLGGPPCPTRADGVRIACDRVREAFLLAGHRPASLLPPNSKKRCVPMTGKQQCERVPGGCGSA